MKRYILLVALLVSILGFAQNGINYKALIKDDLGNIVINETTNVLFSILQNGVEVYREVHTTNTGDNGIVIVTIGEGNVLSGIFEDVNWNESDHSLNVRIDTGSGLVDLGTTPFRAVPYALSAANVNGLEAIDEGNGIGWRLVGNNPNYYGNIGLNAVDLSYSPSNSSVRGATGDYSTAIGKSTEAIGEYSVAIGRGTEAQGNFSFAFGDESEAQGDNSIAMGNDAFATNNHAVALGRDVLASGESSFATGNDTEASGTYSTALGRNTTALETYSTAMGNLTIASGETATAIGKITEASGDTATAMGNHTVASGDISTAIGFETDATGDISLAAGHYTQSSGDYSTSLGSHTRSKTFCSTAIGRYNVGVGNSGEWIESSSLFEIGNGTSDGNRHNALTVNKNGSHYIESNSLGLSIRAESTGLSIFQSGANGIFVGQAENHGAVLEGKTAGILTKSSIIGNPNIILAGNSSTTSGDNGIIISDPNYLSSDIHLTSNDDLVVKLDNNDNEAGVFRIRNGQDSDVFTVDESGDIIMDGRLQIGNETIEDGGTDVLAFSSSLIPTVNGVDRLGGPNRRWLDVYTVNGVFQTSDRRRKTNIANLNYGLNEVLQMQPVSFNWKNKNNQDTKLGLIAQDLQVLVPEVVHTHIWKKDEVSGVLTKIETDILGVYYSDLIPVLINAIKEQNQIINTQNKDISELKNEMSSIKEFLTELKSGSN